MVDADLAAARADASAGRAARRSDGADDLRATRQRTPRTHPARAGADRRHRPRLRRPAAGGRVRARRASTSPASTSTTRRSTQINAGRSYIPDVPTPSSPTCVKAGQAARDRPTWRSSATMDIDQHLRADAAAQDQGPRPVLHRRGGRGDRRARCSRAARHPRVDDLSGHDRRSRAADARGERAQGRTSISSWRSRPSASIRATRQFHDAEHPEGRRRRRRRRAPSSPRRSTAASIDTVVPVSSTRVAEMVKLLENTFRAVNIGLVNELALMCDRMDIDVWEVIDAAKTKPFGFMPFYPGPGPRRPLHPDRSVLPVVEGAADRLRGALHRAGRPGQRRDADYVVERVADALNTRAQAVNGSRVHLLGVAYKRDIDDMRESPALDVHRAAARARRRASATPIRTCRSCSTAAHTLDVGRPATRRSRRRPTARSSAPTTRRSTTTRSSAAARSIVDTRNALKTSSGADDLQAVARLPHERFLCAPVVLRRRGMQDRRGHQDLAFLARHDGRAHRPRLQHRPERGHLARKSSIGDNVKIQNNVSVYTGVILEDDVFCGPSMVFTNVINPRSHVSRKDEYRADARAARRHPRRERTVVCGTRSAAMRSSARARS